MKMKFASRATIGRFPRGEVERRLAEEGIALPVISNKLPSWWADAYDVFLHIDQKPTIAEEWTKAFQEGRLIPEEIEWNVQHAQRQADWMREQEHDAIHPQARETLFQHRLQSAIKKAGLAELNAIIQAKLRDKEHVPLGMELWTAWQVRIATRLEREKAVFAVLCSEQNEAT